MASEPPTMDSTDLPTNESPIAVIIASAIVGGLALLILLLSTILICCFITQRNRENKKRTVKRIENGRSETDGGQSRPLYAQVFKTSTKRNSTRAPKATRQNSVKITVVEAPTPEPVKTERVPHPAEISAFAMDVPKTFRPFAPPPRITPYSRREDEETQIYDTPVNGKYDFLDSIESDMSGYTQMSQAHSSLCESDTNGYIQMLQVHPNPNTNMRKPANRQQPQRSSYKEPRTVSRSPREENLCSSLNIHPLLESNRSLSNQNDYQQPRSVTLPREGRQDDNDIYSVSLTPSMFDRSGSIKSKIKALPYPPIYDRPKTIMNADRPTEVTRENIVEIQDLGMGRFGRVVLAATTGLSLKDLKLGENNDNCRSLLVAIKKLREDADSSLRDAFQNEMKFMSKLKHANVARLLGMCSTGEKFLMMEYMEKGDLHEFLQKQVLVSDSVNTLGEEEVTPLVLLYMGVQVASGMRYLAKKKFVHRDLATRNCLVGRDFIVKISDFGMSRNLYDSAYYLVQGKVILPIRWMAYESFYGKFSTGSDAWSFAITLWELYTMAKQDPYSEMSDEDYLADTMKGARRKLLEKPDICPEDVYDVMQRCWVYEPNMRADFEEIYSRLFLTYTTLTNQN